MKVLVIGGNRFVGLRLCMEMDRDKKYDLAVVNRTGQSPHLKRAAVYKGDRRNLALSSVDHDFDLVVDFACYDDVDAQSAISHFKKVGRYIMISTGSVYDDGANRKEEKFNPATFDMSKPMTKDAGQKYQDGKRRAETLLALQTGFPVLAVRFPFILGPDDYTRRLEFHVERIERNQTIYVPNPAAQISMIHAEDACNFLKWSIDQTFTGPINVASGMPIRISDLLREIEIRVGHRPLLVQAPTPQNRSPYAPQEDSFLNCEKVVKLGFKARPISQWLPDLIDGARQAAPPKILH